MAGFSSRRSDLWSVLITLCVMSGRRTPWWITDRDGSAVITRSVMSTLAGGRQNIAGGGLVRPSPANDGVGFPIDHPRPQALGPAWSGGGGGRRGDAIGPRMVQGQQFLPIDRHVPWSLDAQANFAAVDVHNR